MDALKFLRSAIRMISKRIIAVKLSPIVLDNWDINKDFILNSKNKYNNKPVARFAYNPNTGELVIGDDGQMHAIMIKNQSNSPFDDFVRGVYTGSKVLLRWYGIPGMTSEEIKEKSFNAWYDTKEMLERNGLPAGMPVEMGVSTEDIRQEMGPGYR